MLPGQWALAMIVGLVLALSFPAMVHALALLDIVVPTHRTLRRGAVERGPAKPPSDRLLAGLGRLWLAGRKRRRCRERAGVDQPSPSVEPVRQKYEPECDS